MVNKEFPTDFTLKSNPVDADLLIIADSQDSNEMKKITIGSITADIGDGLIVDSSASDTTTYSSNKIISLNQTQDTALTNGLALKVSKAGDNMTGLFKEAQGADIASATTTDLSAATGNSVTITGTTTITGFGTVQAGTVMKLTFSGILTLTHNATSLILPNAGSNITTAAWDTAIIRSLGSGNWKCLAYQRADGTSLWAVSVNGLTEDTSWDMDADFVLAYDNSASANRKQKINVYRASQAESTTGTATNKFVPPAHLPKYLCGNFTQNANSTTTTTIAHGFGRTPKLFKISGIWWAGTVGVVSNGSYDGTNNKSVFRWHDTNGATWGTDKDSTAAVWISYASTSGSGLTKYVKWVVSWDSTNVTITWTAWGGGNSSLSIDYIYEIIS